MCIFCWVKLTLGFQYWFQCQWQCPSSRLDSPQPAQVPLREMFFGYLVDLASVTSPVMALVCHNAITEMAQHDTSHTSITLHSAPRLLKPRERLKTKFNFNFNSKRKPQNFSPRFSSAKEPDFGFVSGRKRAIRDFVHQVPMVPMVPMVPVVPVQNIDMYHRYNRYHRELGRPPPSPEKRPNKSRKVPQKFWNKVTPFPSWKISKHRQKSSSKVWN